MLETIDRDAIAARGYGFQIEGTYRAIRAGFRVVEVPITFVDRTRGKSKMSWRIVHEAALRVWQLSRRGPAAARPRPALAADRGR